MRGDDKRLRGGSGEQCRMRCREPVRRVGVRQKARVEERRPLPGGRGAASEGRLLGRGCGRQGDPRGGRPRRRAAHGERRAGPRALRPVKVEDFIPVELVEPVAEVLKLVKAMDDAKREDADLDAIDL